MDHGTSQLYDWLWLAIENKSNLTAGAVQVEAYLQERLSLYFIL